MSNNYRITGPYRHGSGYRCRIDAAGRRLWCPSGTTPESACAAAEIVADTLRRQGVLAITDAIAEYAAHQLTDRGNRPGSVATSQTVLRQFFAPQLTLSLRQLSVATARDLYDRLCQLKSPRTGRPLSVDTHRNYLAQAKTFLAWAVEAGYLRANPLAAVKGRGRRRHGKSQLHIDEAQALARLCLRHAAQDDGALAVLLALFLWLRASEITHLTVRSVDAKGRLLHVEPHGDFQPKTAAGHRPLEVPVELQPMLLSRCRHRLPGAYLFPAEDGRPHWRNWVSAQTERFCRLAGVPVVCAHALRGTGATAAIQAGIAPRVVSAILGHEDPSTTLQSYARPGVANEAQRAARLSLLVPVRSQRS